MEILGKVSSNNIKIYVDCKKVKIDDIFVFIKGTIFNGEKLASNYNIEYKNDCELIRDLYQMLGVTFLNQLDGAYAFVIYDKAKNKVYVIKDKLGNVNLFYYHYRDVFIFSTSLKLMSSDKAFEKKIDRDALAIFLGYTYIYEPLTIYENTYKVKKGSIITYENGRVGEDVYFDLVKEYKDTLRNASRSDDVVCEELENVFRKSLYKLGNNESIVGVFLSGGKDSCLLAKLSKDYFSEVNTYTLGFFNTDDEIDKALEIAKYIGTNHHSYTLSDKDIPKIMADVAKIYHEPFADPSILNCTYLINNIKDRNTFLITGDGCDAIFMHSNMYNIYNLFPRIKLTIKKYINVLNKKRVYHNFSEMAQINIINRFNYSDKITGVKGVVKHVDRVGNKRRSIELFDLVNTVVEKYKVKISSLTNYYNILGYTPYYDIDILKYIFTLPQNKLYKNHQGKYIFNKVLYKNIPISYYKDYKKKGFGIPILKWSSTIIKEVRKISNKDFIERQGLFRYDEIINLLKMQSENPDYSKSVVIWCYYCFQCWYLENMEDSNG